MKHSSYLVSCNMFTSPLNDKQASEVFSVFTPKSEHNVNSNKISRIVCFVSLLRATCCKIQRETGVTAVRHTPTHKTKQSLSVYVEEKLLICAHTHTHTRSHVCSLCGCKRSVFNYGAASGSLQKLCLEL